MKEAVGDGGLGMRRVGRVLTIVGMLWAIAGLLLMITPVREAVNGKPAVVTSVFLMGLLGTLSIFTAWGLALYHWATRGSQAANERAPWGALLIIFSFVAAWVYWLTRTDSASARPAQH